MGEEDRKDKMGAKDGRIHPAANKTQQSPGPRRGSKENNIYAISGSIYGNVKKIFASNGGSEYAYHPDVGHAPYHKEIGQLDYNGNSGVEMKVNCAKSESDDGAGESAVVCDDSDLMGMFEDKPLQTNYSVDNV
jgi:hypothetical protein